MIQVAVRIMTVFCKQGVKSSVEGLMQSVAFLEVHYRPNFSSFDALGTESNSNVERVPIAFKSCLMVAARVNIWDIRVHAMAEGEN